MKFFYFLILIFFTLEAKENSFVSKALEYKLYQNKYWYKLLHFNGHSSTILNHNFFLSSEGASNPRLELIETIKHLIKNPALSCRYPARYKWLQMQIGLNLTNKVNCQELNSFLSKDFTSVSLIFTAERYDSPSTIFGHTFLKLNSSKIPYALNYAAKIPQDVGELQYIYDGFSGGFESDFKFLPFSAKDYEYRFGEFRDLIEYKLLFSQDELKNILLHLYEIKSLSEDYYFLSHNCSSEIIRLLDMAKYNGELSDQLGSVVIPVNTIALLEKEKLIETVSLEKSKLKNFYELLFLLTQEEKGIVWKIITHQISVNSFLDNKKYSNRQKKLIAHVALLYFESLSVKGGLKQKLLYPYMKIIHYTIKNPQKLVEQKVFFHETPIVNRFHKVYTGMRSFVLPGFLIGYRYLYRNRFDLIDKIEKNGSIELFDIALLKQKEKIVLEHITLLNMEASPLSNQFFQDSTTQLTFGGKRVFQQQQFYGYGEYALGYRYALDKVWSYHYGIKGGVFYRKNFIVMGSLLSDLEIHYNSAFKGRISINYEKFSHGVDLIDFKFENSVKVSKYINYKMKFEHMEGSENFNTFFVGFDYFF